MTRSSVRFRQAAPTPPGTLGESLHVARPTVRPGARPQRLTRSAALAPRARLQRLVLVLVTGASTGLGLATVHALLADGHEVVLHARSPERVEDPAVLDRVAGAAYGDLSSLGATVALARELDEVGRFDAVVHNAGTMDRSLATAVNVVAPYVLTALMRPPGRSIVLSSGMHRSGTTDLSRGGSYSDSKLWVTTLAMALAGLRPSTSSHAVDPGWVPTRIGGVGAPDDLAEGHRTQAWLATAPEESIEPRTAGYWHHRAPREPHRATRDRDFQAKVLEHLEKSTGLRIESEE